MPDLSDVCDVTLADLEANVALPAHRTWKYLTPPIVRADLCPMLAVYVTTQNFEVLSTVEDYQTGDQIHVAYYMNAIRMAETGGTDLDQALAEEGLRLSELIIARLRTYADAVPGLAGQSEGTVRNARFGLIDAGVWAVVVDLHVQRWPT